MKLDIAIVATICGLVLTLLNILDKAYTNKRRISNDGAAQQSFKSDLQVLQQGNAAILVQLDKMNYKIDSMNERLIRVEESCKSAHHRIDNLEKKP